MTWSLRSLTIIYNNYLHYLGNAIKINDTVEASYYLLAIPPFLIQCCYEAVFVNNRNSQIIHSKQQCECVVR